MELCCSKIVVDVPLGEVRPAAKPIQSPVPERAMSSEEMGAFKKFHDNATFRIVEIPLAMQLQQQHRR